ncbi:hypothetical protein BJ165DRAFT_1410534 [Panaeolus papilionaceus]|nr:hypothetical protein BJ165DRAFT_1410534 [Panaeolus papilionaceus]
MAPIETQASNAKTQAILALGKFQGVYESCYPVQHILHAGHALAHFHHKQQIENHFMVQVDVAQPVDIFPVPDHDNNANLPLDPDAEADNVKEEEGEAELPPPHEDQHTTHSHLLLLTHCEILAILPSNMPAPDIKIEEGMKVEEEELDILLYEDKSPSPDPSWKMKKMLNHPPQY